MTQARTVLIVDDDRLLCRSVQQYLQKLPNCRVLAAGSGNQALKLARTHSVDVILLDQKLPDADGVDLCPVLLEAQDRAKIIFITAYPSFDHAVAALKAGAFDYLSKPFEPAELELAVTRALRTADLEHSEQVLRYHSRQAKRRAVLVGADGGLAEVNRLVALAAGSDSPVLITGETGTGKTLVAQAIHHRSNRSEEPLIRVNCAAIPESLMEAELFGHEKGAFTGALATRKGLFEMAGGGTLFLDEIGEVPPHLQAKLLGVLDEGRVRRIGATRFFPVHARVIAATNIDLDQALAQGRFRRDLFYRLGVIQIHIPPLRARLQDLRPLCRHLLADLAPDHELAIAPDQWAALAAYSWPGNVRELRNVLERAVLVRSANLLRPADLLAPAARPTAAPQPEADGPSAADLSLEEVQRRHILAVLQRCGGNLTRTAKTLGIARSTLARKLESYRDRCGATSTD